MQKEIWKDVVGYEGLYMVSNKGNCKRIELFGKPLKKIRLRKLAINQEGYCRVFLSNYNTKKTFSIHRLVAQAFIPNPENKPYVNHIDSNPSNNKVNNLEWVTAKENVKHAMQKGRMSFFKKGENNKLAVLKDKDIILIRKMNGKKTQKEIAKIFNISQCHVSEIVRRLQWKHIP